MTTDNNNPAEGESVNPGDRDQGPGTSGDEKFVPVSEAIRYRKRAQTAEQALEQLKASFAQLEQQLGTSRETIDALERRQKIDALLTSHDAIDLEAARLLTEIAVTQMDEPDVASAVDELRRHKPYLFRHHTPPSDSAMSARMGHEPPTQLAAQRAASTGDRRDLLDYLRLRRR